MYVQDDWAVNDHLTLNLGVRWDIEETPSYLDFVTPRTWSMRSTRRIRTRPAGQTYAQTLALGGVNINDYISTGNNRDAPTRTHSSRASASRTTSTATSST